MSEPSGRRVRVTLIGSTPPARGVSPYVMALARALHDRDDVELDVLSFRSLYPAFLYPGGATDTDAATDMGDVSIARTLTWWNPLGWIRAGLGFRGDVVHAQWWSYVLAPAYVTVLAIARIRRKRVVLTLHNVDPHEGGRVRRIANSVVLPFAHRIVVHTERNRQALVARGIAAVRIDIVPMGVNTMAAAPPTRDEARRALGLTADAPVALFFGNIRAYKGVDVLLDAFADVRAAVPGAILVIAGQPWKDAAGIADRLSKALPNVVSRLGYVSDQEMAAHYAAADVVVYPYTHFDAQSAAACDAIHYGRAIVVSDTGGLPELVDEPEAVVPAGDTKSLARAIVRVLTDSDIRSRLEAGTARRSLECSWETIAERTVCAYRALRRSPPAVLATSERA